MSAAGREWRVTREGGSRKCESLSGPGPGPVLMGRILEYPNVPSALSDTLGDIVSLSSLKVLGNHKVPS